MRFTLLKARDSSIILCRMTNVEINDRDESVVEDNHLHVYLRIKGGTDNYDDLYQVVDSQTIFSKVPEGFNMIRNAKEDVVMKKYNFSKIFGPKTTQQEIFYYLVKPKLLKFINGHNSTLLTYGVSSSGKTYTIIGTASEPGLVPRSLEYIFRTLPELSKFPTFKPHPFGKVERLTEEQKEHEKCLKENILSFNWPNSTKNEHINTYYKMQNRLSEDPVAELENSSDLEISIWISFAEIYNEHIYDLLNSEGSIKKEKLKLGSAKGQTYIKNLKLIHVTSGLEAYQVLQYGLHHLNYAKTNIHDHSSRSHSIFTIWLIQNSADYVEDSHISHFNFCDLAGAERSKKTLNIGDRLKESNNINTSLLVLGRCIAAVRKAQQSSDHHIVPFRESKLTQLFQKALSGLEDICMIVNINPCRELFDETQHVLNFSAIAKDIVVVEHPVELPKRNDMISQLLSRTHQLSDGAIRLEAERIEEVRNELAEVVCKIEMEEMSQAREVDSMRSGIILDYTKRLEEYKEEMEYRELELRKELKERNRRRLQEFKLEIMEKHGLNISDIQSDDESGISSGSSVETIYISSSDDESCAEHDVETITIVDSDEEEEENDIDTWRRKVKAQENLISEHHKTISQLKNQIEEITSKYGENLKQVLIEKDEKIAELKKRVEENQT